MLRIQNYRIDEGCNLGRDWRLMEIDERDTHYLFILHSARNNLVVDVKLWRKKWDNDYTVDIMDDELTWHVSAPCNADTLKDRNQFYDLIIDTMRIHNYC